MLPPRLSTSSLARSTASALARIENPRARHRFLHGQARFDLRLGVESWHMDEAHEPAIRLAVVEAPIEERVTQIAPGVLGERRRQAIRCQSPKEVKRRQRRHKDGLASLDERLFRANHARAILSRAAHVEGARFDLEAECALRDAKMQDRVRLKAGCRPRGRGPGAGPDHRNDRGGDFQSGRGRRICERQSQGRRGVTRNGGKRTEARHKHANGLIGRIRHGRSSMSAAASSAATEGGLTPLRTSRPSSAIFASAMSFDRNVVRM